MKNAFFILLLLAACGQPDKAAPPETNAVSRSITPPDGATIAERFPPPKGYDQPAFPASSFAAYLRSLPLKPAGTPVFLHNGEKKSRQDVHAAVINIDTGSKDLQQCADAVMRLRAEYLFAQKKFDEIHFNFTNGFKVEYAEWRKGKRIVVNGNRTSWQQKAQPSGSYEDFRKYMDVIFNYAGTLSLSKEMTAVKIADIQSGDVFIQGGSPGHAVIVVDVAVEKGTGKKIFLLAQSYMPAQDIHVLKNLQDEQLSPWFSADFGEELRTPEWTFSKIDLKRY